MPPTSSLRIYQYVSLLNRPYLSLTLLFLAWKSLLLCIAITSPGPGYDTSTHLLDETGILFDGHASWHSWSYLAKKLVRWDAIYFTQIARRGYVFEQEWAFGWLHTRILAFFSRAVTRGDGVPQTETVALMGMLLGHACHLGSVFVLYALTLQVWGWRGNGKVQILALVSAALHVLSPAGLFLSAAYAEGAFALCNFVGLWLFVKGKTHYADGKDVLGAEMLFLAAAAWGTATMMRGNGLLSGLVLVYDAIERVRILMQSIQMKSTNRIVIRTTLQRLTVVIFCGILMGVVAVFPQYLAHNEYCAKVSPEDRRPWCFSYAPSIYGWVQKEYW